jgi:hypothetical protein
MLKFSYNIANLKLVRDESGQSTVEAAFMLPVLLVLVFILLQPGIILYDEMAMRFACAQTCRLVASGNESMAATYERYALERLACVPQHDLFHVHSGQCSWDVSIDGNESSKEVEVSISGKIKLLPLFSDVYKLVGAADNDGYMQLNVSETQLVLPTWFCATSSPSSSVGEWVP